MFIFTTYTHLFDKHKSKYQKEYVQNFGSKAEFFAEKHRYRRFFHRQIVKKKVKET